MFWVIESEALIKSNKYTATHLFSSIDLIDKPNSLQRLRCGDRDRGIFWVNGFQVPCEWTVLLISGLLVRIQFSVVWTDADGFVVSILS